MPRMRGRLYSSCASSTWSFPSALTACWAKMSRISCVRSTTRAASASSSARCCVGSSSSSTSRTSALAVARTACFSSSSLPLPTYVRGPGCARCWTSSPTGSTPAVRASSRSSPSSSLGVGALREHGEHEPALGLDARLGFGWRVVTAGIMPVRLSPMTALADRLAARTLELVDIPSESRTRRRSRARPLARPAGVRARVRRRGRVRLARAERAGRPLVVLAGHYDTVPAQDNSRAGSRTARCTARRERHEGRRRGGARARRASSARAEPGASTSRCSSSARRSCRAEYSPLPDLFDALAARPRGRARDPARADRQHDPGGLPRQPERAAHVPRRQRALGAAVAGGERDRQGARGAGADRRARAAARSRSAGSRSREVVEHHADRGRHRRQRDPRPRRRDAQLPLRARPHAGRGRRVPAQPRSRRARARDRRRLAPGPRRHRLAARAARCATPATSRSSRSRPGRTSPTSRRAASTRSTSAPARPATRTAATSRSRSPRSSTAYESLWTLPHRYGLTRARLPHPRAARRPIRSCA